MNAELISEKAFSKAIGFKSSNFWSHQLMRATKINELNQLYHKAEKSNHLSFIESVFQYLDFNFLIQEKEFNSIPKNGPFITISNHPLGALDGLMLIYLISQIRPDFKVMGNFLLKQIQPIEDSLIAVNPFESKAELYQNYKGIKLAREHISNGGGLGLFPAGEVSTIHKVNGKVKDKAWSPSILKFIKQAEVPIVPIYFDGKNSPLFHFLGWINPQLRTASLAREIFSKRHCELNVRIGQAIDISSQKEYGELKSFGKFLRAKTYSLQHAIQSETTPFQKFKFLKKNEPIALAINPEILASEINTIFDKLLFSQANFEVYLAKEKDIPHVIKEIGRLREITFRAVGEGTLKSRDNDLYDSYYEHLFIWDKEAQKLAGAYRLCNGKKNINERGKKGLYIHSLFKIKDDFIPILNQSIEMGRSFIVKDYQRKRLPLFLLWKGIMFTINQSKNVRYLIGPVSISNQYTLLSRQMIVEFIRRDYYDHGFAKYIKARKKFKFKGIKEDCEVLVSHSKADFKKIDQIISDCEPNHLQLPILVKKYLMKNAKIIGFNLDPKFNNALDGLIILDLNDIPERIKSTYSA